MSERSLVWSYGGGTQSVAIAVLVAEGHLPTPERVVIEVSRGDIAERIATAVRGLSARMGGVDRLLGTLEQLVATH